jgi:hypothetical protein
VVQRLPFWLTLAGSVLGIASFFIPQAEVHDPAPRFSSPYLDCLMLAGLVDTETLVYQTAVALAPVLACLLLLAGVLPGAAGSMFIRWFQTGFFLAWAFVLATLGSIYSTLPRGSLTGGASADESSSPALLLFAGPIALATVVLARLIGGSEPRATAAIVRGSLGLLLLVAALFWLESPEVRWLAGAVVPLLAGTLIAASGALAWIRPPAATSPAPQGA